MINEKSTNSALSMFGVKKFSKLKRKQQEKRHQTTRQIVDYREIGYLSEYYGRMGRV